MKTAKNPFDIPKWCLVERYCEDYASDDWRLVFQRDHAVVELGVSEEQWRMFDVPRVSATNRSEKR